jgi:CHAD domain-containing protein
MKLESLVEEFFAAGRAASATRDRHQLHQFRIAAKRLRYTIELLDPGGAALWLRRLRLVQQQLGDMNDALVAEEFLRSLPSRSPAARKLPAKLHAEAQAHIAAFQRTWQRRFGPRAERAWLTWSRQSGH